MMKIRAFNPYTKKMVYDIAEINLGEDVVAEISYGEIEVTYYDRGENEWKPAPTMVSTGLKDINGYTIYDGDIVEHDDEDNGVWKTYEGSLVIYDENAAMFSFYMDTETPLSSYRNLKIVGNRYETPQLVK